MLWSGFYKKEGIKNRYKRDRLSRLKKNLTLGFGFKEPKLNLRCVYTLYFPKNWQLTVISNKTKFFCFFTQTYYFYFIVTNPYLRVFVNKQNSLLQFYCQLKTSYWPELLNLLNYLLNSFSKLFFIKLKFKGKGYYLYKNIRNTITPQFGYAHRIYKYNYTTTVKFLSKTKVFFFGLSKLDLLKLTTSLVSVRPINIYTGRGIRFAKTCIYKKVGKVSTYR